MHAVTYSYMSPRSSFGSGALRSPMFLCYLRWYCSTENDNLRCEPSGSLKIDNWLLGLRCAVLAYQSSCGVLWAVSELWRVSWLRWPPLWLVCAPQHVSTICHSLLPPRFLPGALVFLLPCVHSSQPRSSFLPLFASFIALLFVLGSLFH